MNKHAPFIAFLETFHFLLTDRRGLNGRLHPVPLVHQGGSSYAKYNVVVTYAFQVVQNISLLGQSTVVELIELDIWKHEVCVYIYWSSKRTRGLGKIQMSLPFALCFLELSILTIIYFSMYRPGRRTTESSLDEGEE
jgi:hypothetical protein